MTFTVALFFLLLPVTGLLDFARAQVAGDVNVRALFHAGRKFGDLPEAGYAMPVGVRLPLAWAFLQDRLVASERTLSGVPP